MSILENLFVREYGRAQNEAPTLIFIHGLLGWGLNWSPIIKHFEQEYHIITYDQRGHGRSFKPKTYKTEDYAQDLLDLMNVKNIQTAHFVGHSMGGRTAQCFVSQHPGRSLSLTLEDIGPNPEPEETLATQQMILRVPVPFASKEEMDQFFEEEFFLKKTEGERQKQVMAQFLKANLQRQSSGKIDWRFSLDGVLQTIEEGFSPRWAEFKCIEVPVLVIRGEKSKHLSQETYEMMLKSLSDIRGEVIEGAGHWVHYQKPEEFSAHVLQFLQNLG